MAVVIPTLPDATSTEITLNSSATDQRPYLGGPIQRISRMGDKWSVKVECRTMHVRQASVLVAILLQGLSEKVLLEVREPGQNLSTYTDGTVTGAAAGRTLTHAGGGAVKFPGQFFSVVKDGVRYLHKITGVSGQVLTFLPMLKVPLTGGEVLEFGAPKIEGFLSGNSQSWTVGRVANTGVTFIVDEAQ
jgi:hypothetical protein